MYRKRNFVSAIIPCFNDGNYIRDAIESIIGQTYKSFEIIVVDDGSDDVNTIKVLDSLNYPKTTVYRKKNGGPASARNFGINKSEGQYILTLDADDKYAPDFLEKSTKVLDSRPEVGMVTSNLFRIDKNGKSKATLTGGDISTFILSNQANASLLFRYKCWEDVGGYDEKAPGFEDWEFAINVTKRGWIVFSIPEFLFFYTDKENSMYDRDLNIRPEIFSYLVDKHENVYKKNIKEVINAKELELQDQMKTISKYKNSHSYKIGNTILKPLKVLRNLFYKL